MYCASYALVTLADLIGEVWRRARRK